MKSYSDHLITKLAVTAAAFLGLGMALMKLIEYMADKIKIIVVITHNIEVAEQMKSRIRLEQRFRGVSISAS